MIGKVYNFYLVEILEEDDSCVALNTWHWKYLGWWFEMYTFLRSLFANLMNIERLPFIIKVKK